MKKVLVIAAHPDDEILGCGGVIAKLADEGSKVYTLVLGEGSTSRSDTRKEGLKSRAVSQLKNAMNEAAKIMRTEKNWGFGFPDNRFDTVPLLDIIKVIENIKKEVRPQVLYTHHWSDLNIDHQITYKAALTAARPVEGETVKEIYSFEIPSSTEWSYPASFNPNLFVDITDTIDRKIKAFKCYKSEMRRFPHPRSEEGVRHSARRWGGVCGAGYAEAFEIVRMIR